MKRWLTKLIPTTIWISILGLLWFPGQSNSWRIAEQLRLEGHYSQALSIYNNLPEASPQIRLNQTELLLIRGDWSQAEQLLEQLLTQPLSEQERQQAWIWYSWACINQSKLSKALIGLQELQPNSDTVHLIKLEYALKAGSIISATTELNAITTIEREWQPLYELRAAQLGLIDHPEVTQNLAQNPFISSTVFALSPFGLDEYQRSWQNLDSSIERTKRIIILAQQWVGQGLPEAAKTILNLIPSTDNVYWPLAQNMLATILLGQNNPEQAYTIINNALELQPNVTELWRTMTIIQLSLNDPTAATQSLDYAEGLESKQPENYYIAALIAQSQNDFTNVGRALDASISQAETKNLSGTYALKAANIYVAWPLQLCTTALEYAQQGYNTEVNTESRILAGQIALGCNQPLIAQQALAPLSGNSSIALAYLRAATLLQLNQPEQANELLVEVVDQAPRSIWRIQAEQLLQQP